ncbi:hypothetical protein SAMN05216559_0325 [Halomicrobium zhouii]|uniref:Uncharacterized protein n=1 Tax=Halomicrobium zhouii TaxID=767519 RepID=A0A1I6K7P6_9EURY|nr:hypothetical protein [Halomicrobium zhouii]SFR87226.1 hypothetical protein SAMN05216559_0325 [Halomicrobium zhouii]
MRWPTAVIAVIVLLVLAPMWVIAIQGEGASEEVEIDRGVSEIQPLDGFLDTPNKLSPSQVGVIVWVALLALVGVVSAAHRFMNEAVRPPDDAAVAADGGSASAGWLDTDDRWVVEYYDASEQAEGLLAMGGLTVLAIVFAALFTGEYFTLARTQYFGVYAAGMFFSLAGLTIAYYAWFVPHVEVVEEREHAR